MRKISTITFYKRLFEKHPTLIYYTNIDIKIRRMNYIANSLTMKK